MISEGESRRGRANISPETDWEPPAPSILTSPGRILPPSLNGILSRHSTPTAESVSHSCDIGRAIRVPRPSITTAPFSTSLSKTAAITGAATRARKPDSPTFMCNTRPVIYCLFPCCNPGKASGNFRSPFLSPS